MSTFYNDIQTALQLAVSKHGSIRKLAESLTINPSTVSKWLESKDGAPKRSPGLRELAPIMDSIGVRAIIPSVNACLLQEQVPSGSAPSIDDLKRELAESEAARLSLSGEIRALERQLARLTPTPAAPSQDAGGDIEVVPPKALGEKEPPSSDLKTENG